MSAFSETELAYLLSERRLGRVATVGANGTPHVVPVGWSYNSEHDSIEIRGHNFERTKKYRDVVRTGRAAIVVDDLASTNPWRPRGVEVRGRAEAVTGARPLIRIHPDRIVSWGLDSEALRTTAGGRDASASRAGSALRAKTTVQRYRWREPRSVHVDRLTSKGAQAVSWAK